MVRRNPKGVASFSESLISVVAGISGTHPISRAQLTADEAPVAQFIAPTMEERERFFTDVALPPTEPVAIVLAPALDEALEHSDPTPALDDAANSSVDSEAPAVSDVVTTSVAGIDLNISLEDFLENQPVEEPAADIAEIEAPTAIELSVEVAEEPVDEADYPSDSDEMASDLAEIAATLEVEPTEPEAFVDSVALVEEEPLVDTVDAPAIEPETSLTEEPVLEVETITVEPAMEDPVDQSIVEEPVAETVEQLAEVEDAPSVDEPVAVAPQTPVDMTESVVMAVLEQFRQQSETAADPDLIRSVTEQVAAQMAAQQTAMRIAQQVLSSQPVAPIVVQQPAAPAQPIVIQQPAAQVPPVAVPGVPGVPGVVAQPVAGVLPVAPVAPQIIPGFDPSAYLAAPGAAPMPVAYPQAAPTIMPVPVQATPVWTPPTGDAVPMPVPVTPVPVQPEYEVPAPASLYVDQPVEEVTSVSDEDLTSYALEASVVYEPVIDTIDSSGPALPSIEAFDPSAYLGMNAVPSLEPVASVEEVVEEPTWETVYEFAPVEDPEALGDIPAESAEDREYRRAQQMLRELSAIRDNRQ